MKRFKNILVVARGSQRDRAAIGRGVRLAKENQARITVASFIGRKIDALHFNYPEMAEHQVRSTALTEQLTHIQNLLNLFNLGNTRCQVIILHDTDFLEVIQYAQRHEHDIIIKVAEVDQTGITGTLHDHDKQLLQYSSLPVWIVKSEEYAGFKNILAAIAPNPAGHANTIIELGSSLAYREQGTLHILHTWLPQAGHSQEERQAALENFLAGHDLSSVSYKKYLEAGNAATIIPAFARSHNINVVIIGTAANQEQEAEPAFGAIAERVLDTTVCSVLGVRG